GRLERAEARLAEREGPTAGAALRPGRRRGRKGQRAGGQRRGGGPADAAAGEVRRRRPQHAGAAAEEHGPGGHLERQGRPEVRPPKGEGPRRLRRRGPPGWRLGYLIVRATCSSLIALLMWVAPSTAGPPDVRATWASTALRVRMLARSWASESCCGS